MRISELFEATFTPAKTVYGTLQALIDFARETVSDKEISIVRQDSLRVWTRGDGSRYKVPLSVMFRSRTSAQKVFDLLPGKTLEVSGEFGSDKFAPAKKSGGMLFVLRNETIFVSTDSVLRNKDVWRSRPVSEVNARNG